tara:strand:- start:250 stop:738 length:489 start_codon:yes stop_codon:yes gene_type:complete
MYIIKKEKEMITAIETKLEEQFNTPDGCIVAEESGNDYMIDNFRDMRTYEPLTYDYRTHIVNPTISTLDTSAKVNVKVGWKIKKWFAESMTGVSAEVTGVDSRGRDWVGMAQFTILERMEAYDSITNEDYYVARLYFKTVEQAECPQDQKDRRIDSAQGLVK